MSSGNVYEYMFVDPNGPYYRINADCADSAYAQRVFFLLNTNYRLPFKTHLPKFFLSETINNHQNKWDNADDKTGRLIAIFLEILSLNNPLLFLNLKFRNAF
ncbi:MAG: hypothetical protein H7281_04965 [Bacteriovorax sp.]|nr:hypothetical protein [Bacteriovorax sp.]